MTSPIIIMYQTTLTVLRCTTGSTDRRQTKNDRGRLILIWVSINVDTELQWRPIGRMTVIARLDRHRFKLALRFRLKSAQFVFHARTSWFTPFLITIAPFSIVYNVELVFLIGKQRCFVIRGFYPYQITARAVRKSLFRTVIETVDVDVKGF